MLDVVAIQIFLEPLGNEVGAVVRDDSMRVPISGYDVVLDELLCCHGRDCFVRGRLHPLSEVINCYQDVAVAIGGCRMYGSDDVYSPG